MFVDQNWSSLPTHFSTILCSHPCTYKGSALFCSETATEVRNRERLMLTALLFARRRTLKPALQRHLTMGSRGAQTMAHDHE